MILPNLLKRGLQLLLLLIILSSCKVNQYGFKASELSTESFYSENLQKDVPYIVYQPTAKKATGPFPIVYLLHGHGGSYTDWVEENEGNVQEILDSLILNGHIPPVMAVTFNGENSWYVNSILKMETAFVDEFMPLVEGTLNPIAEQNSRIIAGVSAGGFGTVTFGMKYPELFRAVIPLSPAAYYPFPPENSSSRKIDVFKTNDQFDTLKWQSYSYEEIFNEQISQDTYPKFYLSTGDDDVFEITDVVIRLRAFLRERGIRQELTIVNGGHDWDVWRYCFAQDLVRIFNE